MSRLEKIEKLITKFGEFNKNPGGSTGNPNFDSYQVDRASLLYAPDCYKARVAVLEEALRLVKYDLENCDWECVACGADPAMEETDIYTAFILPVIDLTPEECLARQKGEG